jgi:hypothetical protein
VCHLVLFSSYILWESSCRLSFALKISLYILINTEIKLRVMFWGGLLLLIQDCANYMIETYVYDGFIAHALKSVHDFKMNLWVNKSGLIFVKVQ